MKELAAALSLIKTQEEKIAHLEQELLLNESKHHLQEHDREEERSLNTQSELIDLQAQLLEVEGRGRSSEKMFQLCSLQLIEAQREIKRLTDRMAHQEAEKHEMLSALKSRYDADWTRHAEEQFATDQALEAMRTRLSESDAEKVLYDLPPSPPISHIC